MPLLLDMIKPVMLMVFLTTISGFVFLNLKKKNNQRLMLILVVSTLNELFTLFFQYIHRNELIAILYSVSFPVFCLLWLTILYKNQIRKRITLFFMLFYFLFIIINFIWFQGTKEFNYYSAVVGSIGYIGLLANESFVQLKRENISFIFSNTYLLLLSPVLLFFGYGQMFGFVSHDITQTEIFQNGKLFDIVADFVNTVYYALIITYIILEKKIIHNE